MLAYPASWSQALKQLHTCSAKRQQTASWLPWCWFCNVPVRKGVCSTQQGLSCHSTNKKLLQTGRSKNCRLGQLSLSGGLLESRLRAQVAVSIQSKMYSNTNHLRRVTGGWWPAFLLWLSLSWTWKKSWAKRVPDCSNTMSSFSRAPKNFHRMSVAASTSIHVHLSTAEMNLCIPA